MDLADQLRIDITKPHIEVSGNVIIVPVASISQSVEHTIAYAKSLARSSDTVVYAVYVAFDRDEEKRFEEKWSNWQPDVRIVTLHSMFRSVAIPLSKFIDTVKHKADEDNRMVTVLIPEFITKKWWHKLLHNQSGFLLRTLLLSKKNVVVSTVPFRLKK
jgi:hypothetical protein